MIEELKWIGIFFYKLKLLELMFWKNREHLSGENNTQALELLKHLSNAQALKVLDR